MTANRVGSNSTYATVSRSATLSGQTSKGRPTVADAFRFQLTALVDLLHSTNPWYVRCIKPNICKAANYYDDKQVQTQLQYLGMLDIIRIRREGFPIHFTHYQFVSRYKALVRKLIKLPPNHAESCRKILTSLHMPQTEWQIGKAKVFLRGTVHEPLEEQRKFLCDQMAIIVQKRWKGFRLRKEFLHQRAAAVVIQLHFRGHRDRLRYLRMRRAAITVQAFVRGMFAREVAAAMREMKRVEEEMRRKEREEEERQLLEQQRKLLQQQQNETMQQQLDESKEQNNHTNETTNGNGCEARASSEALGKLTIDNSLL